MSYNLLEDIKEHLTNIICYSDDEVVLAQVNLILTLLSSTTDVCDTIEKNNKLIKKIKRQLKKKKPDDIPFILYELNQYKFLWYNNFMNN